MQITIAAVIPLYNGCGFIDEAIHSVLEQTRAADEIIVVDDGSTDDGPAKIERLTIQHPITLLRKENGGQSSARNLGIKHSKRDPHLLVRAARPGSTVKERQDIRD